MVDKLPLFSVCIIPILILLWYVYIKDKVEKEPMHLLIILFIGGIISSVIAILLSVLLKKYIPFLLLEYEEMNILQIVFKTLISIALVEEGCKWIINYITIWKNKNFNHMYDPILYCVCVSLGFALLENIIYGFAFSNHGLMPIILRGLISVPSHAVFGIFMGFYLGISKNALNDNKKRKSIKYKVLSLLIPIILHFIYNLLLVNPNKITYSIFITYIIIIYISSYKKVNKLSKASKLLK